MTFENTGTTTWSKTSFDRLGSTWTEDGDNNDFVWDSDAGGSFGDPVNQRVFMDDGEVVAPGGRKTFELELIAPQTPGEYTFWTRMVRDGVGWMGNPLKLTIRVNQSSEHHASLVSYNIPQQIVAGQWTNITVTFENTGTSTWSKATLNRLGSTWTDDGDNNDFIWDSEAGGVFGDPTNQRVFMNDSEVVAPGGRKTFELELMAPQTPGEYTFWARMVRDGVAWMGNPLKLTMDVLPGGGTLPPEKSVGEFYYPDLLSLLLPNADYYIANKAFFFDLSPDPLTAPNDDRSQQIGTDFDTLTKLLEAQRVRAGDDIVTIGGFVPWLTKYTDSVAPPPLMRLNAVAAEWAFVDIVSKYGAQIDADVGALGGLSNASVYTNVPLAPTFVQQNDKGAENTENYVRDKKYIVFYMSDFDSAAWLSGGLPSLWDDPARGQLPLAWSFATDLSVKVPHVFNYMYDTMTGNDYFVSGDNGTGYLNPMMLEGSNIPAGMTSLLDEWEAHNRQSFDRFDLDITGFLISGNSLTLTPTVQEAYSRISPVGVGTNGGYADKIVNGTPFTEVTTFANEETNGQALGERLAQNLTGGGQFRMYRMLLTKPSVLAEAVDYVKTHYPQINFDVVDPYTLMRLFVESDGGEQAKAKVTATIPKAILKDNGYPEWSDADPMAVNRNEQTVKDYGYVWGNSNVDASYKLLWDEEYLYIREERSAPGGLNLTEMGDGASWAVDASAIFLDLTHSRAGSVYTRGTYSVYYTLKEDGKHRVFLRGDGEPNLPIGDVTVIEADIDADRFTAEIKIPWSVFNIGGEPYEPAQRDVIAFTLLAVNGAAQQVMWVGAGDNKEGWADLVFGGSTRIPGDTKTPTPTPKPIPTPILTPENGKIEFSPEIKDKSAVTEVSKVK